MDQMVKLYDGSRVDVTAGTVTIFDLGYDAVRVTSDPKGGNATVNPDGSLAVVLTNPQQNGRTDFQVVIDKNGSEELLNIKMDVTANSQLDGWGDGHHYLLELDDDGHVNVEPGEEHRKIFVSESEDALSRADIAALEDISVDQIDREWLAAHPEYGSSPGMALDTDAGMALWYELTGRYTEPASHWLLFERGHTYEGTGRLIDRGTMGESELHPIYVGTWGSGERPVITDEWKLTQEKSENIVIQGLDFTGGGGVIGAADKLILEDVILRDKPTTLQNADHMTLRNSQILDAFDGATSNGLFVRESENLLIENVLADHNGFERGWESGNGDAPDALSHNIYIQWDNLDVTFRNNVTMQGSSFGAQIRSGGVVEGNAFLDNNIALNVKGGSQNGVFNGNTSLILDNIVSSGGHRGEDIPGIGGLTWGIRNLAQDTSMIGNIIAHLADPNDPVERAEKTIATQEPVKHKFEPTYDDTIVYNWVTDEKRDDRLFQTNQNVPDIDPALLDDVTLHTFLEDASGGKVTGDIIESLAPWLRENWDNQDLAQAIVDFFQGGFGMDVAERTTSQTIDFVPDVHGDGMRWDNRLNWSTEDKPIDGDRVNLNGNWVTYSGTVDLAMVDIGDGGILTVRQGHLDVADLRTGPDGRLDVQFAGQVWTEGYQDNDTLTVSVSGGRFANTGSFDGAVDLTVTGGETLLATAGAQFNLDGTLTVEGGAAKIGFDGQGGDIAELELTDGAVLSFRPQDGDVSTISEFRSGHWDTRSTDVVSKVDLGDGTTTLDINLKELGQKNSTLALVDVDQIHGGFADISHTGSQGLRATVTLDFASDRLDLSTVAHSSGDVAPLLFVQKGSEQTDLFYLSDGANVQVRDYGAGDVIDLSPLMQTNALMVGGELTDLSLEVTGPRDARLLYQDGNKTREILQLTGDDLSDIRVQVGEVGAIVTENGVSLTEPFISSVSDVEEPVRSSGNSAAATAPPSDDNVFVDPDPVPPSETSGVIARDDSASTAEGDDVRIFVLENDED
ncbi:MAG: right-handed parallel beta-helix repeat-containing protein, partial [Pseudomonadota bacterium]